MGRPEKYQPISPETKSSSSFQAYCLELSPYTAPDGKVKTLDITRVYSDGSAVLVDCCSNGSVYDPLLEHVGAEANQADIHNYETARTLIDQSIIPSDLDLNTLDTCLSASLTDTGISYSGYGSGAIFAIHLSDAHEENFSSFWN